MSKIRNWSKVNDLMWVTDKHRDIQVRIIESPRDSFNTYHIYRITNNNNNNNKILISARNNINKARSDASKWMRRHPHG